MLTTARRLAPALAVAGVVLVALTLALRAERGRAPAAVPASGAASLAAFAAFQQSGDPVDLERSEHLAAAVLERSPSDPEALEAQARAAGSRHDFRRSLTLARASLRQAPERVAPQGVAADALIELGRYHQAFALTERRLRLRPDLDAYARASYAAELRGRPTLAVRHMELAAGSGRVGGSQRGWALQQLAQLRLRLGDVAGAERAYAGLAAERPRDPEPLIGHARVAAARGRLAAAARWYHRGIAELPDADHYAELAAVEAARGRRGAAEAAVGLARGALDRLAATEDAGLERSVLVADWARPSADDIARARAARAGRPSVLGDAVLAWTLTRAGRCREAGALATRSLRLGTRDPLLLFRAGQAAACAGESDVARRRIGGALAINPAFSARWAPVARRRLTGLG